MLDAIKNLGIWGSIGVLAGIALVLWIEPTSNAGVGLVLVVSVILTTLAGAILTVLSRWVVSDKTKTKDESKKSNIEVVSRLGLAKKDSKRPR